MTMMQPLPMAPTQATAAPETGTVVSSGQGAGEIAFASRLNNAVQAREPGCEGPCNDNLVEEGRAALEIQISGEIIGDPASIAIQQMGLESIELTPAKSSPATAPAAEAAQPAQYTPPTRISQLLETITNRAGAPTQAEAVPEQLTDSRIPETGMPEQPQRQVTFQVRGERFQATVESWQARYAAPGTTGSDQVQVAQQSQTRLETQLAEFDELATTHQPAPPVALKDPGTLRQDANTHFIHSNLPNAASGLAGQPTDSPGGEPGGSGMERQGEHPMDHQVGNQSGSSSDTPLIFSLDQGSATTTGIQGVSTASSPATPLAPGELHPHETSIVQQVQDHFSLRGNLESGRVVLKLHPEELGELRMEIKVEQDNIKAHITTQNPQIQEILDRHMPRLREALEQQGFNLEQVEVTVAAEDRNSSGFFREQSEQHLFHQPSPGPAGQAGFTMSFTEEEDTEQSGPQQGLNLHA